MKKVRGHFEYEIVEVTDTFVRGFLDIKTTDRIYDSIHKEVDNSDLDIGLIGNENTPDKNDLYLDTRQSEIYWLQKSKKAQACAHQLVIEVNKQYFDLELEKQLPPDNQYTVYRSLDDHYDWHQDHYDDEPSDDFTRVLSLSICLSPTDFYQGAEFFIKDGSERNVRVFKMHYGEFIIFPSDVEHKVNALREGERESLVIWYGHHN